MALVSQHAVPGELPAWGFALLFASLITLVLSTIELPPPPSYQLSVRGDATFPDGQPYTNQPIHVSWSSALQVVLRPEHDVKGPVEVRAYLVQGPHRLLWPVRFERAPSGTMRLRKRAQDLPRLSPGDWELRFHIDAGASSLVRRLATLLTRGPSAMQPPQELRAQVHVGAPQDLDSVDP